MNKAQHVKITIFKLHKIYFPAEFSSSKVGRVVKWESVSPTTVNLKWFKLKYPVNLDHFKLTVVGLTLSHCTTLPTLEELNSAGK